VSFRIRVEQLIEFTLRTCCFGFFSQECLAMGSGDALCGNNTSTWQLEKRE
jgi:hypothetical protein